MILTSICCVQQTVLATRLPHCFPIMNSVVSFCYCIWWLNIRKTSNTRTFTLTDFSCQHLLQALAHLLIRWTPLCQKLCKVLQSVWLMFPLLWLPFALNSHFWVFRFLFPSVTHLCIRLTWRYQRSETRLVGVHCQCGICCDPSYLYGQKWSLKPLREPQSDCLMQLPWLPLPVLSALEFLHTVVVVVVLVFVFCMCVYLFINSCWNEHMPVCECELKY